MSRHSGERTPAGASAASNTDYRVAHLLEHLAAGHPGELGVRAEVRGGAVLLTGTVASVRCREEILAIVHEELAGVPVHCDLVVAKASSPDHAEELT